MTKQQDCKINQNQQFIRYFMNGGGQILLFITLICVFVPFFPSMPGYGLDPSWSFAMNQAVAQGLLFGREMIFTFGPYASIYTKEYHPVTDHLMITGSTYLSIYYWVALFFLAKNAKWYFVLTFLIVLLGLMDSRDALLFSCPLIAGLVCFKIINPDDNKIYGNTTSLFLATFLFSCVGLLPLIKGSLLILCLLIVGLSSFLFLLNKKLLLAIAVLITPIFSMAIFWIASGQYFVDLPNFLASSVAIISGYTEAMAVSGNELEIIGYCVAGSLLLLTILCEKNTPISSRLILICMFFVFLMIAFKAGFVRHDRWHAITSGISIILAALLLSLTLKSRQMPILLAVSFLTGISINSQHMKISLETIYKHSNDTYFSAWQGLKNRFSTNNSPRIEYKHTLELLKKYDGIPLLPGTTDIYSYNQSSLIASGNQWNPRPIPQSYSVYTPSLAEKNKIHLLSSASPDNVIFRIEPIDNRIPSIEDGASWPMLLSNYQPTAFINNYLYLRKRTQHFHPLKLLPLGESEHAFGEVVPIPKVSAPIFAEISITPSILGRFVTIFFKPSQLQISLNLDNNTTRTYRIIAGMAKSGLMISPLIENTTEFGLLFYGGSKYLTSKNVKSFSIKPVNGSKLWENDYKVALKLVPA